MRLARFSNYSLRVRMHLALQPERLVRPSEMIAFAFAGCRNTRRA